MQMLVYTAQADDLERCLELQPFGRDDQSPGRAHVFLLRLEVELWLQKDEAYLDKVHIEIRSVHSMMLLYMSREDNGWHSNEVSAVDGIISPAAPRARV